MYSNLWDATFARPPSRQGSVFVRIDLSPEERRYALAREALSALITSKHGRAMGLQELLVDELRECGEFFARHLLMPARQLHAYLKRGNAKEDLARIFAVPLRIVEQRLQDASYHYG
jgi:Zn-dependent peptidase ImmA (M78 family)